jgi:hypothetical protein
VQSGLQSLLKFPAESWRRFAAKILQRLSICICKRRELDLINISQEAFLFIIFKKIFFQGDQIGRIFALWVSVYFGDF